MSDTVFKQVNYDLNSLIKYIELGEIGLPDIQHDRYCFALRCNAFYSAVHRF